MEGYTPLFPDYQLKAINARSLHEQNLYKKTYRGIKILLHESGFYFAGIESFDKVFINLKKEFKSNQKKYRKFKINYLSVRNDNKRNYEIISKLI